MDDKRILLKQMGWSDELIDKCLSAKIVPDNKIFIEEYPVFTVFEQDTTTLTVNIDVPTISDGSHLI